MTLNLYKRYDLIVCILCLLYLCLIPIYGLDIIDSGFILSFVGRLKEGQQLYKDFDYVRPFGTPIFWDLLLKPFPVYSEYLVLISRYFNIVQFLIMGYLVAKILDKTSKKKNYLLYTILILGNFIIMPWHTTDGMFFSIISIYLLNKNIYLSSILFALVAASCKQSFYFMPIFIILSIVFFDRNKPFKISKYDAAFSVIGIFLFLYIFKEYRIFDNKAYLINQLHSSSNIIEFLTISIKNYLKPFPSIALNLIFFTYFFANFYFKKFSRLFHLLNLLILISTFVLDFYPLEVQRSIFSIYLVYYFLRFKESKYSILLLIVGWCSSISWGYNTPILTLFFIVFFENSKQFVLNKSIANHAFMFFLLFFGLLRLARPYSSDNCFKTPYTYVLNTRLISGIWMPEKTFDYFKDGEITYKKYGSDAVFLPGTPLMDVINNSFPNRVSWELDVEYPSYKKDLKTNHNFIILDKLPYIRYDNGFYKSSYTSEVLANKKLVDSTEYFFIYK